jgi:hypothetical protein
MTTAGACVLTRDSSERLIWLIRFRFSFYDANECIKRSTYIMM